MTPRCCCICLGLGLTIAAAGAGTAPPSLTAQEPTFPARATGVSSMALRQLFADYWRWHLADEPEDATRAGVHAFDDRWRDWSKTGRATSRERQQEFLRNFQYAGLGNLTNRERLSVTLVQQRLASELATENLRLLARLSPGPGGAHQEVFRVIGAMPAASVADYERQIARLRALPAYVQQHIDAWTEQVAGGVTQPASVVNGVLAEIEAQRGIAAGPSPLLAAFRNVPASVPAAERARLDQEARTAYAEQFAPAWERLERFLRDSYRPRSRDSLSVGTIPAGPDGYAGLLAFYGAPSIAVDGLHEQAIAAIARQEQPAALNDSRGEPVASTVPEFRRHLQLPAFTEGWQMYAAGRTRDAAVRAALDSGIHVRGWPAEQAHAFAAAHLEATEAARAVDLVTATPARALAVFAGAQAFAALRRTAEARLGARFDERELVQAVLGSGALSLDLVELQVEEFLKARQGR
jgi:uncharacterized protein (DUF885 family)